MHTNVSSRLADGTQATSRAPIENDVKLVIWDLDDTFWNGTLAEGGAELVPEHTEIVKTLAARGIVSSIVSKNDHEAAKAILQQAAIWDYFVFPSISYDSKGKRVCEIIQNASLRPENVLYIDDNVLNLEEARFFNAGIMLAHPGELLPCLLEHPSVAGKPDPHLKRLKQYQLLERRFKDRQTTDLSNEEFLRTSQITISFDFDVHANFERILDLLNRTNQLNYTKVRLTTDHDIDAFRRALNTYGVSAACISCRDRYGDHGIIGFYALKRTDREFRLLHFVFSCRTMNMGIEQFVYEFLGKPAVDIAPEVAYGLYSHTQIDWISISDTAGARAMLANSGNKLLLVGGCELQQLATYCSSNRTEFVTKIVTHKGDDFKVRYDDPYFFSTERNRLLCDDDMRELATWRYEDALLLDRSLAEAEIIILALRAALRHVYVRSKSGNYVRMALHNINLYMKTRATWFTSKFSVVNLDVKRRLVLIQEAFDIVNGLSTPSAAIFVIGAATQKSVGVGERLTSDLYNNACRAFCLAHKKFHFVDVGRSVSPDHVISNQHLTPAGYRELSSRIMDVLGSERHN